MIGLPGINIAFVSTATASIARSSKGIVGMILRDANTQAQGAHTLSRAADIPAALDAANTDYVTRAFFGYIEVPRRVVLYVMPADATDLTAGTDYFETVTTDYIVGPHDITTDETAALVQWVKERRQNGYTTKTVLPDTAANHEGVINFAAEGIMVGDVSFTTAQYCGRIAGLITGTPMNISCTFAQLPEVTDIERLPRDELDEAIDKGQFMLYHDGEKVKAARGVNSLTTFTPTKSEAFRKIKIVEILDMIRTDIARTAEDSFIGKYENTYDNKCVLITAIMSYFAELETAGLIERGQSFVGIDMTSQMAYLRGIGVDVDNMSGQEIKEANTGSYVFLAGSVKPVDAIEDITFNITI